MLPLLLCWLFVSSILSLSLDETGEEYEANGYEASSVVIRRQSYIAATSADALALVRAAGATPSVSKFAVISTRGMSLFFLISCSYSFGCYLCCCFATFCVYLVALADVFDCLVTIPWRISFGLYSSWLWIVNPSSVLFSYILLNFADAPMEITTRWAGCDLALSASSSSFTL